MVVPVISANIRSNVFIATYVYCAYTRAHQKYKRSSSPSIFWPVMKTRNFKYLEKTHDATPEIIYWRKVERTQLKRKARGDQPIRREHLGRNQQRDCQRC